MRSGREGSVRRKNAASQSGRRWSFPRHGSQPASRRATPAPVPLAGCRGPGALTRMRGRRYQTRVEAGGRITVRARRRRAHRSHRHCSVHAASSAERREANAAARKGRRVRTVVAAEGERGRRHTGASLPPRRRPRPTIRKCVPPNESGLSFIYEPGNVWLRIGIRCAPR